MRYSRSFPRHHHGDDNHNSYSNSGVGNKRPRPPPTIFTALSYLAASYEDPTATCHQQEESQQSHNDAEDGNDTHTKKRYNLLVMPMLSAAVLAVSLVAMMGAVEQHYPETALARFLQYSPSLFASTDGTSSSRGRHLSSSSTIKQQKKQQQHTSKIAQTGKRADQTTKRRRRQVQQTKNNKVSKNNNNKNKKKKSRRLDDQNNNNNENNQEDQNDNNEDQEEGDDAQDENEAEEDQDDNNDDKGDDYYAARDDDDNYKGDQEQQWDDEVNDDAANQDDGNNNNYNNNYQQDDYVYYETEAPVYIDDDDFYAFQEDPGPPRLLPISSRDVAAFVCASMGLTLGASGGIGGGGIVVPVYILVAGLAPKMAIPLGSVTVLGGSLAGTIMNTKRRHPLADRPIIDWDLVLVTEPLTLIGALMGTLLHRVLSEKFLIVTLVLLLSVSAHSTLAKAKRMHDAETRYIQKLKAVHMSGAASAHKFTPHHVHLELSEPPPRIVPLPTIAKPRQKDPNAVQHVYFATGSPASSPSTVDASAPPPFAHISMKADDDSLSNMALDNQNDNTTIGNDLSFEHDQLELQKTRSESSTPRQMGAEERQQILILNPDFITLRSGLLEEEKFTPRSKIIALCLMFSTLMFLNIMIGGGAFPSPWGIRCGSVAFWVVQVIMVAFLVASAWAAQTYLVNRHEMKEIVRFDYVHGDIKWDARSAIIYPALFICAGTFAGMFGIGGGMITVPLMLAMGVHPGVVSATSSAMILFTSFASASSYLVFGLILYDYAIVCFVVGFFASLFGNRVMRQARQAKSASGRNFERNSYIAFCIGGVILTSALLMTMDYVFRVYAFDDMEYPEGLCEGYRI